MFFVHPARPSRVLKNDAIMTNDIDKREGEGAPRAKDSSQTSRQARLKLALRDNLRRRKSQARARDKMADAPSNDHERALDDDTGSGDGR
jgi:hypothetical protein